MLRFFLIGYANKNTAGFVQIFMKQNKRTNVSFPQAGICICKPAAVMS